MEKRWLIILVLFTAVACAPQDQVPQDEDIVAPENSDILSIPNCQINYIDTPPTAISPFGGVVDPLPPHVFSWDTDCVPYSYKIRLFKDGGTTAVEEFDNIDVTAKTYTSQVQLEPFSSYTWELQTYVLKAPKAYTSGHFNTGPVCALEDLVPPTLVSPADGSMDTGKGWGTETEVHAVIKYPIGNCRPKYFDIWYSLSPNFEEGDDLNPFGPAGGKKEGDWLILGDDSNATKNCNIYYWRSRAVIDAGHSDWSETWTFFLDVNGNCIKLTEFNAPQNANCRGDPWAGENYASVLWEGDSAELLGLNEDGTWGMFKLKNEIECWINMELVEPDPPDALFFPGYYPILEHGEQPNVAPEPSSGDEPSDEQTDEDTPTGCIVIDESGQPVCQDPCLQRNSTLRACP